MAFGSLGALGRGYSRLGALASTKQWMLAGASIDLDFANGRYFGGSITSLVAVARASTGTDLVPSSVSGYAYTTYGNNVLRVSPNFGLFVEESRTNQLLNSAAPVTQTTASLGTGTYTLWVNGSGSATSSAGTATITGAGTASNGTPNVFTVTVAGTVTVTVAGSLNFFQLELGAFGTSGIVTSGTTGTRAADVVTGIGALANFMINANGSIVGQVNNWQRNGNDSIVSDNNGNSAVRKNTGAEPQSATSFNGSVSLATANTATWTGATVKAGVAWSAAGRSLVLNNGTIATDANLIVTSPPTTIYFGSLSGSAGFGDGVIRRLTFWNSRIADATLKAFTQ